MFNSVVAPTSTITRPARAAAHLKYTKENWSAARKMTIDYLAPFSGKIPALERNILKYRAVQMILIIFYCEHLKRKIRSVAENHLQSPNRRESDTKPVGTDLREQLSQRKSMAILQNLRLIDEAEASEIRDLIDFRNTIAHQVHKVVSDIASSSLVRQLESLTKGYNYHAADRLKYYIDVLDKRLWQNGHALIIGFEPLQFESAEKVYAQELANMRKIIDRQYTERSRIVAELNNELSLKHTKWEDEWHPYHPENKYVNGRLTPRGVEVCYRLYDSHKSPMAVALLMHISLRAAKKRKKQWHLAGGHRRKTTPR